jgi:hypothetical protein
VLLVAHYTPDRLRQTLRRAPGGPDGDDRVRVLPVLQRLYILLGARAEKDDSKSTFADSYAFESAKVDLLFQDDTSVPVNVRTDYVRQLRRTDEQGSAGSDQCNLAT